MNDYNHLTDNERATISALRQVSHSSASIARFMNRNRSTIIREIKRNACKDGHYRVEKAEFKAKSRRRISRRNLHLTEDQWTTIKRYIEKRWSPEQIVGHLKRHGVKLISHEMI